MFQLLKKFTAIVLITSIFLLFGGFFNLAEASSDAEQKMSAAHGACELILDTHTKYSSEELNTELPCCVADGQLPTQIFSTSTVQGPVNALPIATSTLIPPLSPTQSVTRPCLESFDQSLTSIKKTIIRI